MEPNVPFGPNFVEDPEHMSQADMARDGLAMRASYDGRSLDDQLNADLLNEFGNPDMRVVFSPETHAGLRRTKVANVLHRLRGKL